VLKQFKRQMTSIGDIEVRAIIKFCVGIEKTPTETCKMIQASSTKKSCRSLVFRWHDIFWNGRESIDDWFPRFSEIKAQLPGRRFDSGLELQIETQRIVSSFDNIWYKDTYNNGSRGIENVSLWMEITSRSESIWRSGKFDFNIFSTDVTLACSGYASVYVLF
jgi:hypothetical protein